MGKTDFPTLAALVRHAALVLTNNTSVMHLADATRTPSGRALRRDRATLSVAAESDALTGSLHRVTSCRPCYAFRCPYGLECLDISLA